MEEAELLWIKEVQREMKNKDGQVRGAEVRVQGRGSSGGGLLRRPLQLLYPLGISFSKKYMSHRNSRRKVEREEIESGVELQSRESEEED